MSNRIRIAALLTGMALVVVAASTQKIIPLRTSQFARDMLTNETASGFVSALGIAGGTNEGAMTDLNAEALLADGSLNSNKFSAELHYSVFYDRYGPTISNLSSNLNASNITLGTVPLPRMSGITSNQMAAGTDAIYRAGDGIGHYSVAGSYVDLATNGNAVTVSSRWWDLEYTTNVTTVDGFAVGFVGWSDSMADGQTKVVEIEAVGKYEDGYAWVMYWKGAYHRRGSFGENAEFIASAPGSFMGGGGSPSFYVSNPTAASARFDIVLGGKAPTNCRVRVRSRTETFTY